jgi:hypothetical protein
MKGGDSLSHVFKFKGNMDKKEHSPRNQFNMVQNSTMRYEDIFFTY